MSIVSSVIKSNRPYGQSGQLKVEEQHTDITGAKHRVIYIANSGTDLNIKLAEHAVNISSSLVLNEQQRFIAEVVVGDNPFVDGSGVDIAPDFNTANELRTIVLEHFLSLPDPTGLTAAVPLLDRLTDPELMFLLSINQAKVDEIRASANDVTAIGISVDNYTPPLGGA